MVNKTKPKEIVKNMMVKTRGEKNGENEIEKKRSIRKYKIKIRLYTKS